MSAGKESLFQDALRLRELSERQTLTRPENQELAAIASRIHAAGVEHVSIHDTYKKRMHLVLSTIYTTHGYLDDEGEIDTAAKFRAIERLARLDWDDEERYQQVPKRTGTLIDATAQELLTSVVEPETPEERDAAWNEIVRRDEALGRYALRYGYLPDDSDWGRVS